VDRKRIHHRHRGGPPRLSAGQCDSHTDQSRRRPQPVRFAGRFGGEQGMKLSSTDLADLATGAAFLGTGGGGDPYIGRQMAQACLDEGLTIEVIDPKTLADNDFVIPTAMMGAPTVLVEKIPSGQEAITALQRLEHHLGRRAAATMPIEIGGINSTIPLVVGARLGIPIVDADGMGRALPELQMETFAVHGIPGCPMAIANEWGDTALIETRDNRMMEWL